jgi:hypothetical protein
LLKKTGMVDVLKRLLVLVTQGALQHDPSHPEDVLKLNADEDGQIGDDTADALRYLVTTKPREIHAVNLRGL